MECCIRYECFDPCACSAVDVDKLILESKVTELKFGKAWKDLLYHDFTCDKEAEEKIEKLQRYRQHLEEEFQCRMMGGKPCLSCDELQCLYERVKKLTASCDELSRPDLIVDKSNVDKWIARNPYCVARERWEYLVYDILCDLQLQVQVIDTSVACDITADICANLIPCDVIVAAHVCEKKCETKVDVCAQAKERCDLDFDIMVNSHKCDIGMDLHIQKHKCEITADFCARLMECNLTMDVISCVYESGCCLSIEACEPQGEVEVMLHTENNSYPFFALKSEDIPNIQMLEKYGVDTSDSEYLKDPEGFIKKLNRDYNG